MPRSPRTSAGGQDALHPTVKALAAAIGKSRQTVHEWQVMTPPAPPGPPYSEVAYRLWAKANGFSLASPRAEVAILLGERADPLGADAGDEASPASSGPLPTLRGADVHDEAARRLSRVRELQAQQLEMDIATKTGELVRSADVLDLVETIAALAAAVAIDVPELVASAVVKAHPAIDHGSLRDQVQQICDDARRRIVASMLDETRRRLRQRIGAPLPGSPGGNGGGPQPTIPNPSPTP